MARIKGKWVGQIVMEMDYDENDVPVTFDVIERRVKSEYSDMLMALINKHSDDGIKVTVTQLHADLYRDEPSEWTKEEATP